MIKCLNYLRDHSIILGLLGLLSIGHAAFFWFSDASLFQSDFPSSEFLEETEIVVEFSMEITAGVSWLLGVVLLGASQLKANAAKPIVIATGIGLITTLPLLLQHNYGDWTDPSVLIICFLGLWAVFAGVFVVEENKYQRKIKKAPTKKKPLKK